MNVRLDKTGVPCRMAELGLTGSALAEIMGVSKQALSAILARGTCSHINAAKLADALGVEYETVLAKEDST